MTLRLAGVDLGGTQMKLAVAALDGTVLHQSVLPTKSEAGPAAVLDRIAAELRRLTEESQGQRVVALGLGVPGLVDVAAGVTKFLPNLATQWRDVAAGPLLGERLGCPVRVMNDARVATIGELHFGHGRDRREPTMVLLTLGTGVGGGVVVEGRLRLGPYGAAGEIGHQTIAANGPRCGCGNTGCLEVFASATAIAAVGQRLIAEGRAPALAELVANDPDGLTTTMMGQVADRDPAVAEAIEAAGRAVGIALANVVTTLHPELIVIGGGVANFGEILFRPIRETIRTRVGMFPTDGIEVLPSKLGEAAGLMGALQLAIELDGASPEVSPT